MSRLSTMYRAGTQNGTRRHLHLTQPQDAFPLLDAKEITVCLQSCDFVATEELVQKPTSHFVKTLFEQFLDTFMGVSVDSIHNNEEEDVKFAVNLVTLHRAAHKFLEGCGVYDLTLMDLVRPEPFRIRRILSAVVNFARFREEHSAECEALVVEYEQSLENIRKAQADNASITEKLNELKSQIESDQQAKKSTLKQVNTYNSKLETELKKLKKQQEAVTLNHTQYREEKARLIEKLDDIQYLILESSKEIDVYRGYADVDLVVLARVVDDLKTQLRECEQQTESMHAKDAELQTTTEALQNIENELKLLFRIIEEISNDLAREKDVLLKMASTQELLDQYNIQLKDLSRQAAQLQRQVETTQEKTDKLKVQAEERINKSQQQLLRFRADYAKLVEERKVKEEEYAEKRRMIAEIEAKIAKLNLDYSKDVRGVEMKVGRLNAMIKLYMEEVGKAVDGQHDLN